jgi:hypothetical protein
LFTFYEVRTCAIFCIMKRENFQTKWEEVVDKGFSKYEGLTEPEMVWFLIEPIITDGLIDHYVNYGAEHNNDLIKSLLVLNVGSVKKLFSEANMLFKNGVPIDINQRNDEIVNWPEDKANKFEELDKKCWEHCNELENSLNNYLIKEGVWA